MKLKHFKLNEFACPCCHLNRIDQELVEKLDLAREIAGIPFIVNSGYRCDEHNAEVGGTATSSHMKGLAADICIDPNIIKDMGVKLPLGKPVWIIILNALLRAGFTRLGIKESVFIHVDVDHSKPNGCWTYE